MNEATDTWAPPTPNAPTPKEMENLVINWFKTGLSIEWIPLIYAEDIPPHITQQLESIRDQQGPWILHTAMDLHKLPEGLTGWLMPSGHGDTFVVCGYWDGEVAFMLMTHRDTGEVVTYRTSGHGKGVVH
jgi:hypothetical protein